MDLSLIQQLIVPAITGIITCLAGISLFSSRIGSYKEKVDALEKRLDKLDGCVVNNDDKIRGLVAENDDKIRGLVAENDNKIRFMVAENDNKTDGKLIILADKVSRIEGLLESIEFYRSNSPVTLTERGEKVIQESGAKFFIDANKDTLVEQVLDRKPLTYFDIQEISKLVVEEYKDNKEFIPMKNYMYENPTVPFKELIIMMGIYLRDIIIEGGNKKDS